MDLMPTLLLTAMMSPPKPQGAGGGSAGSPSRRSLADVTNRQDPDGRGSEAAGKQPEPAGSWNPLGKFSTPFAHVKCGNFSREKTTANRVNTGGVQWTEATPKSGSPWRHSGCS